MIDKKYKMNKASTVKKIWSDQGQYFHERTMKYFIRNKRVNNFNSLYRDYTNILEKLFNVWSPIG